MDDNRKTTRKRGVAAGKRVGGALYLHRSATNTLENQDAEAFELAKKYVPSSFVWSVVKISRKPRSAVSFLDYEDFDEAAFPALKRSCQIDLTSGSTSIRNYVGPNPPILHRKELLLALEDPRRKDFSQLTQRLEAADLFSGMSRKGRRKAWNQALSEAGFDENGSPLR